MHQTWNKINFPIFVVNNGNWDIYANDMGYCVAIPTIEAEADGCKATHYGPHDYVRATLGVIVPGFE